jgi:hypothetical protein
MPAVRRLAEALGSRARQLARIGRRYGWLLFASVAAAVGFAVWGMLAFDEFGPHVIGEFIGISASIPVTVLVVDAILNRRRSEAWSLVREQTGRTIESLVQQAAFDFHVALPEPQRHQIASPAILPEGGHAPTLRKIAHGLRGRENDRDPAVIRLHDALGQPLYHLVDRMGPRIYASGNPELARRFGALEEQTWAWQRDRALYEDLRPEALWENAADTAEAMADLVEYAHRLTSPG